MNNTVAIIIARGGSRRLKRKNILRFCGKPLVEWSIIQARTARCLSDEDVFVSTDDDEIAAIAADSKAQVIRRPDWPDADLRSAMPVYAHAIGEIRKERALEHVFTMLPTTPCRLPGDMDRAFRYYHKMRKTHPDCREVLTLTPHRETVIYDNVNEHSRIVFWDKDFSYLSPGPSVEIKEAAFYELMQNFVFYDADSATTKKGAEFTFRHVHRVLGKWFQGYDIDDQDTFELNELLFERYILQGRGEEIYWAYKAGGEDERVESDEQGAAEGREVL